MDLNLVRMLIRSGIVGHRPPMLKALVVPLSPGDLIILTTDGNRLDFGRRFQQEQPRAIAEYISLCCCTGLDDGLVLVTRYQGAGE